MFSIGICTDFVNLPEAASLGFDYVELPLDALAELTVSEFNEFADYADGTGIRVAACNHMLPDDLPVTGPGVNATALHGYLKHAFNRARRLGVRVVTLDAPASRDVPPDGDFPFAWRQLGNFLRLSQGHAKTSGITVALEPLKKTDCSLLNLVSEAVLIAGLLQLGDVAVAAHWGAMSMASEPMGVLRQAGPLLRHVHLENALTRALPREGDGEDYGRMLSVLTDIGYEGGVSLSGTFSESFAEDAVQAQAHIRALISKLGMKDEE